MIRPSEYRLNQMRRDLDVPLDRWISAESKRECMEAYLDELLKWIAADPEAGRTSDPSAGHERPRFCGNFDPHEAHEDCIGNVRSTPDAGVDDWKGDFLILAMSLLEEGCVGEVCTCGARSPFKCWLCEVRFLLKRIKHAEAKASTHGPTPDPVSSYWCVRCVRWIPASECELDEGEPAAGLRPCMKHYGPSGEHEVHPKKPGHEPSVVAGREHVHSWGEWYRLSDRSETRGCQDSSCNAVEFRTPMPSHDDTSHARSITPDPRQGTRPDQFGPDAYLVDGVPTLCTCGRGNLQAECRVHLKAADDVVVEPPLTERERTIRDVAYRDGFNAGRASDSAGIDRETLLRRVQLSAVTCDLTGFDQHRLVTDLLGPGHTEGDGV